MRAAPFVLSYLGEVQLFSNERSDAYFAGQGIHIPTMESYLPALLNYYRTQKGRA